MRFKAEQARTTPGGEGDDERAARECWRRAISQSQRSASVRGWPAAILAMLDGGWNWGLGVSFVFLKSWNGKEEKGGS